MAKEKPIQPGHSVVITNGQRKVIKHTAPVETENDEQKKNEHKKNKPNEGQGDNN